MNRAALGILLVCTGCGLHGGPPPRQLPALGEEQMQQALQMMQSRMEGAQDLAAGRDTEAARAYKEQTEAIALQANQREEQLRKDPKYVSANNASSCARILPASKVNSN